MRQETTDHICPYCQKLPIEAIATLPYVRDNGLGVDFNAKTITGCKSFVRKQLLLETLHSSVDGWASPAALVTNPVRIAYGLAAALIAGDGKIQMKEITAASSIGK